jgi:DNA-binding XRE family transcriptional regulator
VKQESTVTEALAAALQSAREAREHTHFVLDMLAPKLGDSDHAGYAIASLLDIFTETCAAYALIHQMMKPCLEISGIDLSPVVAAVMAKESARAQGGATPVARAFGHVVREWRENRSLHSDELAARAGLDAARYREIDRGKSEPNLAELTRIATALGLRSSELVLHFESVSLVPRAIGAEVVTR